MVTCRLPLIMKITINEYVTEKGDSPFEKWFNKLDVTTAAKVTTALTRMKLGNFSNVKNVGAGVYENKLNFGPGYRIYYGKDADTIVILLCGGTKKLQSKDIAKAKQYWQAYKARKRQH